jgi:protein-disulfide isomerase
MDKKFVVILLVIVGIFVGYLYTTKQDSTTDGTTESSAVATTHTQGAGNKKVTLVAYEDFQCPVCGQYFPILNEVKNKYGDDITFQFRHFPIDSIHPNARAAHRTAEAAGNQGKFFEMHDLLYENIQSWSASTNAKSIFDTYAKQLNLDMTKFNADFASEQTNEIINADVNEGKKLGVSGTPSFILNGRLLADDERRSLDDLVKTIDAEIAKQNP